MGNTGKPSKGCILCVKRRIKCDQTKPSCLRCENVGQTCPGYLNKDDWVFKSENDRARRKALRLPKIPKTANASTLPKFSTKQTKSFRVRVGVNTPDLQDIGLPTPPLSLSKDTPGSDSDSSDATEYDTILPGLVADLEIRSVCLFMETFTLSNLPVSDDPAYLDFLPDLYVSSDSQSCLREAVAAVSQANFLNRYGAHHMSKVSAQAYGKALALTNNALANPILALTDETIASVFLLGLYELVSYHNKPKPDQPGAWASHVAGTNELLRMRGRDQLSTPRGRQLFRLVHSPILIRAMMSGHDPSQESIDLVRALQGDDTNTSNGAAMVSIFFQKAAAIRAKILRLIKRRTMGLNHGEFIQSMEQLIDDGVVVDASFDMKDWAFDHPHWQPRHNSESVLSPSKNCPTDWYYFSSIWVMGHWARYWTARICLYKSLLDGVGVIKSGKQNSFTSSAVSNSKSFEYILQTCADEIIASIGFAFGELDSGGLRQPFSASPFGSSVGVLHIFWSLGVVVYSPYTTMEQRDVARKALRKLGMERGIAQAMYYLG